MLPFDGDISFKNNEYRIAHTRQQYFIILQLKNWFSWYKHINLFLKGKENIYLLWDSSCLIALVSLSWIPVTQIPIFYYASYIGFIRVKIMINRDLESIRTFPVISMQCVDRSTSVTSLTSKIEVATFL